jgi:DNA-binding NtrC family response regulator
MKSQLIRIVDCGLGAESIADIRSAASSASGSYTIEILDLRDASVNSTPESSQPPEVLSAVWVLCFSGTNSVCQVQSVLSRFAKNRSHLIVVIPEVAPLIAAFGQRPVTFLRFPPDIALVAEALRRAVEERERMHLMHIMEHLGEQSIIGQNPAFMSTLRILCHIAPHDISVLLQGETGTGKDVFARAIHYLSPRHDGPFVAFQCGAVPVDLLENELFGHDSGAYTGAISSQRGLVEFAEGGTLFLDEIHTLPLLGQVKILRLLQEKQFKPLGIPQTRKANIRIIAACNVDLPTLVKDGKFRKDLFYRLSVVTVDVPPLRERREDIPLLAQHFLKKYTDLYQIHIKGIAPNARQLLCTYPWEGNVRELEIAIHRAVILAETEYIGVHDLRLPVRPESQGESSLCEEKRLVIERFEREYIERTLLLNNGNVNRTALAAGKDRRVFLRLMHKYGIDPSRFRVEGEDGRD